LNQLQPDQVEVAITQVDADERLSVEEAELDEMWSFVNSKRNPRWLWHAIDRRSGQVLAYAFGRRKDNVFLQMKEQARTFWNQAVLSRWVGSLRETFGCRGT
jgi:insertion element IS1 protein InsB